VGRVSALYTKVFKPSRKTESLYSCTDGHYEDVEIRVDDSVTSTSKNNDACTSRTEEITYNKQVRKFSGVVSIGPGRAFARSLIHQSAYCRPTPIMLAE